MAAPRLLLELDLTEPLLEEPPVDPVGRLQARRRSALGAVVDGLRQATDDPQVVGLVAKVGGGRLALAQAQEVAGTVQAFRASGKLTVAYAETFGEGGPGTPAYLLASAFEEVWLQPSGDVGLVGVAAEVTFLRGLLDKAGVQPQLRQRYEYKNAGDRVTRRAFTPAHREAVDRLAESAYEQVVASVARARRISHGGVRALVDRAPLTAPEALQAGLVDRVGYRDEVYADLRRRLGPWRPLFVDRYRPRREALLRAARRVTGRSAGTVALVYGTGQVRLGRSGRTVLGPAMGSDTVCAALRAAARDERVGAVVFRVDSPGGSYVASDTIWRAVASVRAAGKPVVVSMGRLAGSGGYYVAAAADVIVALPGTLTGSIGVVGGKADVSGLLERAALDHDAVERGRHARMFSPRRAFTDEELGRLDEWLDGVYHDFVAKVAQGRRRSWDEVHEVARGRVWTGADACSRGLVDELGGLRRALELARDRGRLPADAPVQRYPRLTPVQRLRPPRSSDDPAAAALSVSGWGPWADLASLAGLPPAGPLTMPALALR